MSQEKEKNQELFRYSNLSCFFTVVIFLLILSIDAIITQFIPVNPNDNYVLEKNKNDVGEMGESSFLKEISLEEFESLIRQRDEVFVLFGDSHHPDFSSFLSVLKSVLERQHISSIYFLNSTVLSDDSLDAERFCLQSGLSFEHDFHRLSFLYFHSGMLDGKVSSDADSIPDALLQIFS